jgi:hypothetical protein
MAGETQLGEATVLAFLRFLFRVDEMFKPAAPPSPVSSPARSLGSASTSLPAFAEEHELATSELMVGEIERHDPEGEGSAPAEDEGEDEGGRAALASDGISAAAPEQKVAKKRGRKPSVASAQPELLLTPVKRARKR